MNTKIVLFVIDRKKCVSMKEICAYGLKMEKNNKYDLIVMSNE